MTTWLLQEWSKEVIKPLTMFVILLSMQFSVSKNMALFKSGDRVDRPSYFYVTNNKKMLIFFHNKFTSEDHTNELCKKFRSVIFC